MTQPLTISLSLVSHTNAGKTTLARTLLGRDIGEVRDEAHVTLESEVHTMVASPMGDRLQLWDTPGFGDSLRLAKRLAQAGQPIGWFMSEVWDRLRDRGFWSSQRALRNILDEADVVLYLVNASEAPQDAGYLDAELRVLTLLDKPVIVLLNQLGRPQSPQEESAEVRRWAQRTQSAPCVRKVLALDAFARCWVQEGTLLDAVDEALPGASREAFDRLREAWLDRNRRTFHSAMGVLAERLTFAATDREVISEAGWTGRLREVAASLGLRREGAVTPREVAMAALASRLDAQLRASTESMIRLHGLEGKATDVVLERLAEHFASREPVSEGRAALWGGVVSGALAGLKADLLSGGLTMGGGLLAGGVLGALGAAGLARGYNLLRGVDQPTLVWSEAVLDELAESALLGYLAVAHYGRGRGEWAQAEQPAFWQQSVDEVVKPRQDALHAIWRRRGQADDAGLREAIGQWLSDAASALLERLYPGHTPAVTEGQGARRRFAGSRDASL